MRYRSNLSYIMGEKSHDSLHKRVEKQQDERVYLQKLRDTLHKIRVNRK